MGADLDEYVVRREIVTTTERAGELEARLGEFPKVCCNGGLTRTTATASTRSETRSPIARRSQMTGMIGVISDHAARYTWFSQCLADSPSRQDLTTIEWRVGANRGTSRDSLARACLDQGCDWLFIVDDDQVFQPDALQPTAWATTSLSCRR